jgi:hypothetical protein
MSFPSPTLPAPPLADYQLSFKGLTMGGVVDGSRYQLVKLPKGIDVPAIVGGDVQRALDQGELIGIDLLSGRDIELEQIITDLAGTIDDARQKLGGVMSVAGAVEAPLYLALPSGVFACMARPKKHATGISVNTLIAGGEVALSMLHATDPRWYRAPTKTQTVGLGGSEPLAGLKFPVKFPLKFAAGIGAGVMDIANNGTIEMRPVLIVTGPCKNPRISNLSIVGAPELAFEITLAEGDTLTIDTDFQTVTYLPVGAPFGVSRRDTLVMGSEWWNLPPGVSVLEFRSSDLTAVAGVLTCQSADAYAAL